MWSRMWSETRFHYNLEMRLLESSSASPSLLLLQWVLSFTRVSRLCLTKLDQVRSQELPYKQGAIIKGTFWTEGSYPRSKQPLRPHISISLDTETIFRGCSVADESVTGANGSVDKMPSGWKPAPLHVGLLEDWRQAQATLGSSN